MRLLIAALFWAVPTVLTAQAELLGTYVWTMPDDNFGGMSGIEVSDDGNRFTALTDRGHMALGVFERQNGAIANIQATLTPLRNDNARGLPSFRSDSEGLAIRPDGRLFVSFERYHRVWTYSEPNSEAAWLPRHEDFRKLQVNSSLEALAIDAQGRLYTIPERSGLRSRPFPVYRYSGGAWTVPFSLRRDDAYLVTGADIFDDTLFLLERDFTGLGFRTRVRAFDLEGQNERTILETRTFTHDNLEGISVWRESPKTLRITLISDDNFRAIQQTQIVEYRIND
jgi:hypothetical protein